MWSFELDKKTNRNTHTRNCSLLDAIEVLLKKCAEMQLI